MKEMNLYNNAEHVQISEDYYQKLLKYRYNYFYTLNSLLPFFEFRTDGTVCSVDAEALADFLVPYMENYNRTRK